MFLLPYWMRRDMVARSDWSGAVRSRCLASGPHDGLEWIAATQLPRHGALLRQGACRRAENWQAAGEKVWDRPPRWCAALVCRGIGWALEPPAQSLCAGFVSSAGLVEPLGRGRRDPGRLLGRHGHGLRRGRQIDHALRVVGGGHQVAGIVVRGRVRRLLPGPEAPGLATASLSRAASTLKCASDSSPFWWAAHTTSSNRARPASCASSRCRFLVKTVVSKLRSSRSMSRHQRQQVVLEALTGDLLATPRIQGDQRRGLQQLLRRHRGLVRLGVHVVEDRRELRQGRIGHRLDPPQRMVPRHPFPESTMASMLRWGWERPRIGNSSVAKWTKQPAGGTRRRYR